MSSAPHYFPREHGATAMLLMPFGAAAVLARTVRWQEAAALAAVLCVFMTKDPLVVLARQRWVWKQVHPETRAALRWVAAELAVMAACGVALLSTGSWIAYMALFGGAVAFSGLAVWVNVRNRQRGIAFQVASAVGLTSTSLTAALAATGGIPQWGWWLWGLMAAQSAAGIFTVHARLEARVAAKKGGSEEAGSRRVAILLVGLLGAAGVAAAVTRNYWISGALVWATAGYAGELVRQNNAGSLQMPLTQVGRQTLTLSLVYGALVVRGLW